jgi:hypothetical protein
MAHARSLPPSRTEGWPRWLRQGVPSWLASLVFHAALIVALMLTLPPVERGLRDTLGELGEVSLSTADRDEGDYFDDELTGSSAGPVTVAKVDAQPLAELPTASASPAEEAPPVDVTGALPPALEPSVQPHQTGLTTGAGGFTQGSGAGTGIGTGPGAGIGSGRAKTRVFGIEAEGSKFVYVFDRSGSMGGSGRNTPLDAAKAELLSSLESLDDIHQFQIIFYNERPHIFSPSGGRGRLVFGNAANRSSAQQFVRSIVADGGTRHLEALELALKLQPDVIFFLTDADQPQLSPSQLQKIRRANGGSCSINAIEFGLGPEIDNDNFLIQLARQNGGRHTYVDVARPVVVH